MGRGINIIKWITGSIRLNSRTALSAVKVLGEKKA
jgi:hypothetical protein